MRKIKFRGHNGTEWIYSETIMQDGDMCYMLNNDTGEWESVSYLGQFTGQKDAEGVEIYEGDVIEFETVYEWDDEPIKKREVVFENGIFTAKGCIKFVGRDCKVVGIVLKEV